MVAGKSNYTFQQSLNPDGKKVVAIAIRRQNAAGTAKDVNKSILAADNVIATASLKVSVKGDKIVSKNLPLDFLAFPTATADPFCVQWDPIEFNNTVVTLDPTVAGFTAGHVIEITVWYDCQDICKS